MFKLLLFGTPVPAAAFVSWGTHLLTRRATQPPPSPGGLSPTREAGWFVLRGKREGRGRDGPRVLQEAWSGVCGSSPFNHRTSPPPLLFHLHFFPCTVKASDNVGHLRSTACGPGTALTCPVNDLAHPHSSPVGRWHFHPHPTGVETGAQRPPSTAQSP